MFMIQLALVYQSVSSVYANPPKTDRNLLCGWRFEDTKVIRAVLPVIFGFQGFPSMAGAVQQMMREVMDIRQAADYLGISGDTLYRYASEGFIPAFKLGNRWRFKRSLLDAWMVKMSGPKTASNVSVMPRQKKPAARAR